MIDDDEWREIDRAVRGLIIGIAILAIVIALSSCRTTKVIEKVNWVDSVRYEVKIISDTTHIMVRDTIHETEQRESEDQTSIIFGSGGGTYNTDTGQATNVAYIHVSSREQEYKDRNEVLTAEVEQMQTINDSLMSRTTELEKYIESESQPAEPSFYKRAFWWIVGALIALLLAIAVRITIRIYLKK